MINLRIYFYDLTGKLASRGFDFETKEEMIEFLSAPLFSYEEGNDTITIMRNRIVGMKQTVIEEDL